VIGQAALLSKVTSEKLGLKKAGGRVYVLELNIDHLPVDRISAFKLWSNYPGVTRDLAVVLDQKIPAGEVLALLKKDQSVPLIEATIFDLYQGDKIPSDKKSLALRLFFQNASRTLTDEEVNGYFNGLVSSLEKAFSAQLRS
jgi:phenylalanyl-tRNA synthetase beta chain